MPRSEIALTDIRITPEKYLNLASYDATVIYTQGDTVLFKCEVYGARWWNINFQRNMQANGVCGHRWVIVSNKTN